MAWTERKLAENFGVALSGQQLNAGLPQAELTAVYDAVLRNGVAVVTGQDLTDEEFYRFGAAVGDVVELPRVAGVVPGHVGALSNLDENGNILPPDAFATRELRSSHVWHIDSTYVQPRVRVSMLYGQIVPPVGADTHFCDLRLAWEALPPERQAQLEGLTAYHWLVHSRQLAGLECSEEEHRHYRPIPRPLVARHEASGRKALCLATHISGIAGMGDEEGLALVGELTEWAAAPERCYVHRWSPGDLLLWDNHAVMHRATPYDLTSYKRDMRTLRTRDLTDA